MRGLYNKFIFGIVIVLMFIVMGHSIGKAVLLNKEEKNEKTKPFDYTQVFNHINYLQTFSQKDEEYLVYFYMKDCPDCKNLEGAIKSYHTQNSKMPIYLVDMKESGNAVAWYNWKDHRSEFDKEIGELANDRSIIYYEGENENKYINSTQTNKFGDRIIYKITTADEKYLTRNPKARSGKVYASNTTPNIDKSINEGKNLIIAGTPTLIRVKNGKVVKYYFDIEVGKYFAGETSKN